MSVANSRPSTPPPSASAPAHVFGDESPKQVSKKPCHLASRLAQRRNSAAHAECTLSCRKLTQAQRNHSAFLEARRAKAAQALDRVQQARVKRDHLATTLVAQHQSVLEETLKSANEKRQQLLRDQATQCARTVQRAKAVAQLQSIRHQQKIASRRHQMEERLRKTEQRRNRILRLIRLAQASDSDPATASDSDHDHDESDVAAEQVTVSDQTSPATHLADPLPVEHRRVSRQQQQQTVEQGIMALQRRFRYRRLVLAFHDYHRQQFTLHDISRMGPDAALQRVTDPQLIAASDHLLHTVWAAVNTESSDATLVVDNGPTSPKPGSKLRAPHPHWPSPQSHPGTLVIPPAQGYKNQARFFLMGLLLTTHPKHILPSRTDRDNLLAALAQAMGQALAALARHRWSVEWLTYAQTFARRWDTYYHGFVAWKKKDSAQILETLIAHYLELDRLWHTVKPHAEANESWRAPIAEQRETIKEQIIKFGGDAALQRLLQAQTVARQTYNGPISSPAAPATPHPEPITSAQQPEAALLSTESVIPTEERVSHPSASGISGVKERVAEYIQNEKLAHEIVVNPYFQLPPLSDPLHQAQAVARRAYLDHLRDLLNAVKAPSDATDPAAAKNALIAQLLDLFQELRDLLLSVVPAHGMYHERVKAQFDLALLRQQWERPEFPNNIDFQAHLDRVIAIMRDTCAPARDEDVQALAQLLETGEVWTCVLRTLGVLQTMRADNMNYQIRMIRPYLAQHAVEYEQRKFAQALSDGQLTLVNTHLWLAAVAPAGGSSGSVDLPTNPFAEFPRALQWYFDAVLAMLFATKSLEPSRCPETWLLDMERVFAIQNELQAVTIVAALLILAKNMAPPVLRQRLVHRSADRQGPAYALKNKLSVLLQHDDTRLDDLVAEVHQVVAPPPATMSQETGMANANNDALSTAAATISPTPLTSPTATTYLGAQRQAAPSQDLVRAMVKKTLSYRDPVYSVLSRRMQSLLKTWLFYPGCYAKPTAPLSASARGLNVPAVTEGQPLSDQTAATTSLLRSHGLDLVEPELHALFTKVQMLVTHNRRVYGKHYDELIHQIGSRMN
ncbi:hypothetical protein H4R34_003608 [Dimargaris verticillata]|uniref:T-complex protein 11-domain-containing protein n=1 Tax=Dimargaris verticillata TaxID=2761393 RepID=A0A9W8B5W6_9FUNG|nr:hypothetical protein H4R34_003608 [Dimargaris verticillata]